MSLFDYYIMIDWSGAARRTGNRADTIWIAHGFIDAATPFIESPSSRTEAVHSIRSVLQENLINDLRTLICFDFAYGYPVDFAAALEAAIGKSDPCLPWLLIWKYLSNTIINDQGTAASRRPSNRSNRFEVANDINALLSKNRDAAGPFWCTAKEGAFPRVPQVRPQQPFQTVQGFSINSLRLADQRAASDTPFRLFGTASVGSQSLTGIPCLHKLRNDPAFAGRSAVWPFETGWATKAKWLPKAVSILHAEIYPSVREPKLDTIRDRGQVRSMWEWARDLDQQNLLWCEFSRPTEIEPGSKEDIAIQLTEGWILGASPTVRNH